MQILYDAKTDLLYLRLDDRQQQLINKRLSEEIVLDLGEDNRIVGIEILDASKHLNLERLLPVRYLEDVLVDPKRRQHLAEVAKRMRAAREAMLPLDMSVKDLIEEGRER
ncbi:MAG: DUF2283 domain-containing protein [Candidatus Tectomicrobia bacterium]|nr:DUF2283 domain-containing protein [Candidatus Tectomicrobia bacterium]